MSRRKSKKGKRGQKGSDFLSVYKSIRKPAVPRTQVHPDKKYDRRDKSWMDELEEDDLDLMDPDIYEPIRGPEEDRRE